MNNYTKTGSKLWEVVEARILKPIGDEVSVNIVRNVDAGWVNPYGLFTNSVERKMGEYEFKK
jgi:hypothetical protein